MTCQECGCDEIPDGEECPICWLGDCLDVLVETGHLPPDEEPPPPSASSRKR